MIDETEALLRQATSGDTPALEVLLERFLPGLRAFVQLRTGRVLRRRESSSDLVQSVCREVLENAGNFRYGGELGFKRWLYRLALNKLADRGTFHQAAKRDIRREETAPADGSDNAMADLFAPYHSFYSPSQQAAAREELALVERAFEQLPDQYREVILLARVQGLSRAEIGVQLGRSEGAVRVLLLRALAQFAELVDPPD